MSNTPNLLLNIPTPLDPSVRNTWGTILNTDYSMLDDAVSGILSLNVSGSANVVLTSTVGAQDQARHMHFVFTGLLTGNILVFFPQAIDRTFSAENDTTGAFTLTLAADNGSHAPAGTTQVLTQDANSYLFLSDGVNIKPRATFVPSSVPPGIQWAIGAGTANAITATYTIPNVALTDGLILAVRALLANTTTTPTFAPDGLTAHVITKKGGVALASGDIPGPLAELLLRYNLAFTRWELLNPAVLAAASSATQLGIALNARMSVTAASATATFTADLITAATALNGTAYALPSYSKSINLGTTGAGGMDTGAAPANGFVSLYAIYNPGGSLTSILACNATTSSATIYAGANMPAGYTASALIGVWPTDGTGKFKIGIQNNRTVAFVPVAFGGITIDGAYHTLSVSSAVPIIADAVSGTVNISGGSGVTGYLASSTTSIGELLISSVPESLPFGPLAIITAQTIAYKFNVASAVVIFINAYTF